MSVYSKRIRIMTTVLEIIAHILHFLWSAAGLILKAVISILLEPFLEDGSINELGMNNSENLNQNRSMGEVKISTTHRKSAQNDHRFNMLLRLEVCAECGTYRSVRTICYMSHTRPMEKFPRPGFTLDSQRDHPMCKKNNEEVNHDSNIYESNARGILQEGAVPASPKHKMTSKPVTRSTALKCQLSQLKSNNKLTVPSQQTEKCNFKQRLEEIDERIRKFQAMKRTNDIMLSENASALQRRFENVLGSAIENDQRSPSEIVFTDIMMRPKHSINCKHKSTVKNASNVNPESITKKAVMMEHKTRKLKLKSEIGESRWGAETDELSIRRGSPSVLSDWHPSDPGASILKKPHFRDHIQERTCYSICLQGCCQKKRVRFLLPKVHTSG